MKTIVMDLGVAGSDLSAGQMVYIREMKGHSVFPDVDQMLQDLRPHMPAGVVYACEVFPVHSDFEKWRKQVARFMGFPQHLLDATHRIR